MLSPQARKMELIVGLTATPLKMSNKYKLKAIGYAIA
jgi:hypothetical protein